MQLSRTKFRKSIILSIKKWIKCFPGKIQSIRGKNLEISLSLATSAAGASGCERSTKDAGAVGGCVKQRVSRAWAAQRICLQGVGHHMQEGAALVEAVSLSNSATLPYHQ